MRHLIAACLFTFASAATAGENLMLVLDASGSMWGRIDDRPKVEIARETVAAMLQDWKSDNALGLVAYGHRRKGDCADIETLIPVGPLDAAAYLKTVNGLNALGMTPLSAAVIQAADALKSSEQKATVILVSDGEETCKLDPCAVGAELEKTGVDFTAHVIGFDVADVSKQAPLQCLASATGGRYFNARDARELASALQGAIQASTEPAPPPATATIAFETPVSITQMVTVKWTGPADAGDYLAFARPSQKNGEYVTYSRSLAGEAKQGETTLAAPADAGAFELRYVNPRRGDAVLARTAVEVVDAVASIEAPDSVAVGTRMKLIARGPFGSSHWVGFAPAGSPPSTYLDYGRLTGPVTELELMTPATPGQYELRYVLNEKDRVLVSRPITVGASEAMVSGPATVMAGDLYRFEASGPADQRHWIGFAPAGAKPGEYRDYVRPTGTTTSGELAAPATPGAYELRYVLNESERAVATQAVTVTPAEATLTPQGDANAEQRLRVAFTGPRGRGNWIGFVKPGTLSSVGYSDVSDAEENSVELRVPAEAGSYELVFVVDNKAIARQPITVR